MMPSNTSPVVSAAVRPPHPKCGSLDVRTLLSALPPSDFGTLPPTHRPVGRRHPRGFLSLLCPSAVNPLWSHCYSTPPDRRPLVGDWSEVGDWSDGTTISYIGSNRSGRARYTCPRNQGRLLPAHPQNSGPEVWLGMPAWGAGLSGAVLRHYSSPATSLRTDERNP